MLEGRQLGCVGEVHPTVATYLKVEGRLVAFEIDVEPVLATARIPHAQPLPRFPAVERDLAVVVEEHVAAASLLAAINDSARDLLENARAFDEYHGCHCH